MTILLSRLARAARTRWRAALLLTGALLTALGIALPSGAVLVPGLLILLVALLNETATLDCSAATQLTGWRWHG